MAVKNFGDPENEDIAVAALRFLLQVILDYQTKICLLNADFFNDLDPCPSMREDALNLKKSTRSC